MSYVWPLWMAPSPCCPFTQHCFLWLLQHNVANIYWRDFRLSLGFGWTEQLINFPALWQGITTTLEGNFSQIKQKNWNVVRKGSPSQCFLSHTPHCTIITSVNCSVTIIASADHPLVQRIWLGSRPDIFNPCVKLALMGIELHNRDRE